MSMDEGSAGIASAPELTALGKAIEMLRIERGLAKQHLARAAGISRQQLWRVMTGKSELTNTLAGRLTTALGGEPRLVSAQRETAEINSWLSPATDPAGHGAVPNFATFASRPAMI